MAETCRALLLSQGYVVLPSGLTPSQLDGLRLACDRVKNLATAGKWPHLRTLPKQFPPWTSDVSSGIWGVQHLMHPDLPCHEVFAESYFSSTVIEVVQELLSCSDEELVMELYNLLITPTQDFSLRWHRDDIPPSATPQEELAKLLEPAWHAQWNLALYDDNSLIVIPGSHARARTNGERKADPYEENLAGQLRVRLRAGDIVFYNNNILHRGVYKSTVPQMTLHGSIGHVSGGYSRARNVLQHGVGTWVHRCNFDDLEEGKVRNRAKSMRNRLLELGKETGHIGFSHED